MRKMDTDATAVIQINPKPKKYTKSPNTNDLSEKKKRM